VSIRQFIVLIIGCAGALGMWAYCPWEVEKDVPTELSNVGDGKCGGLWSLEKSTVYDWRWSEEDRGEYPNTKLRFLREGWLRTQTLLWLLGMYAMFLAVRPKRPDDNSSVAEHISAAHPDLNA